MTLAAPAPVVHLRSAQVHFARAERALWSGLDLDVAAGEWLTVLGGNGSGKTTLMRSLLGLQRLTGGAVQVIGKDPRSARRAVGYVPQHSRLAPMVPLRAKDLVALGWDGDRLLPKRRGRTRAVNQALAAVGALDWADQPLSTLSGGQQQLVRIAQALVCDPQVLLCDEPLLSLDLRHQGQVIAALHQRREEHGTAVVFVTHEINPVLPVVDRVLYLVGSRFSVGTVDEVMTSPRLSQLYDAPVEVLRRDGRIFVLGTPEPVHHLSPALIDQS